MAATDRDEIDALAGEYVLGTLDADERRAAEARRVRGVHRSGDDAGRAASGRDGLSRVLRWTPLGGRIK